MLNTAEKLGYLGSPEYKPDQLFSKNIFLCIHSADRAEYLKILANFILKNGNSFFVWAHKDDKFVLYEDEKEQYLEDIYSNNIFVVAITGNFFKGDDLCLWEFNMAVKRGMKILPLLIDKEYAERFNEYSGNMHALMPFDEDETAIPFDKKLRTYLENTLKPDDRIISGVKKCFDSSLFISYRKKDRKYIDTLLRTIHSVPELQRVSVWYDESERAGEAYDKQIWDAFLEGEIGILLVTKNLLEEGNFVAKYEYPFIWENRKLLLPIVADDVDIDEVSDFLVRSAKENNVTVGSLQGAVRLSDRQGIVNFIYDILSKQKLISEGNRENDYYLGIAYQVGFLVEEDVKKALFYFNSAARKGCLDGYERMAMIYRYGLGVSSDIDKAVNIWTEYLNYLNKYRDSKDFAVHENIYSAFCNLIDLYHEGGYEDEIRACQIFLDYVSIKKDEEERSLWEYRYLNTCSLYARALLYYAEYGEAYKLYKFLIDYYRELIQQFETKGLAIVGNYGINNPKEIYKPLTDYLRGKSKCIEKLAINNQQRTEAVNLLQDGIRIKRNIYNTFHQEWAIESIYLEYYELEKLLVNYGMYNEALGIADEDYQILNGLIESGKAKSQHVLAVIKNTIVMGDIAEHLNPDKQQGLYVTAYNDYVNYKKAGGDSVTGIEKMLRLRGMNI